MKNADPYAVHALLLVYGETPAEIASLLRSHADAIERGLPNYAAQGVDGVRLVRASQGGTEEAGHFRMYAVIGDGEGACASDATALFSNPEHAERFKQNLPPYEPDDAPSMTDDAIVRADCIVSVWNSYDADPHAAPRAETRGAA